MENNASQFHKGRTIHNRTGTIVIVLFLALLVGSMVAITHLIHHGQNATAAAHSFTVSSSQSVYISSGDGILYKLDAGTGTLQWQNKVAMRQLPAPIMAVNGVAYAGTLAGNVVAYDTATNKKLWSFQTGDDVIASPLVVNSMVYIGSSDGQLYALNAQTGTKLWSYDTRANKAATYVSTVVIVNGIVYGSTQDGVHNSSLYALDAKSGKQVWRKQFGYKLFSPITIASNTIYLSSSKINSNGSQDITKNFVEAYKTSDGTQLWQSSNIGDLASAPTVDSTNVYVGAKDGNVYAFNLTTGKLAWKHASGGTVTAAPVVMNGTLYVGVIGAVSTNATSKTSDSSTASSSVLALNATSGSLLWQHAVANYEGSPLAAAGTMLYVGTSHNMVYALNLTDGSQAWSYHLASTNPLNNAPLTVASK